MLFPSLGLTFIDQGGKVGIDEHRLDGFQLHRAAVAYASVSDGPSPRLAGAFPWPNERGVAEKSKVGKVKVRGASTLYAPSYSLIVIIVIIHSFIHSFNLAIFRYHDDHLAQTQSTERRKGAGDGCSWRAATIGSFLAVRPLVPGILWSLVIGLARLAPGPI